MTKTKKKYGKVTWQLRDHYDTVRFVTVNSPPYLCSQTLKELEKILNQKTIDLSYVIDIKLVHPRSIKSLPWTHSQGY